MSGTPAPRRFTGQDGLWILLTLGAGALAGAVVVTEVWPLLLLILIVPVAVAIALRNPIWVFPAILITTQTEAASGSFQLMAAFPIGPTKLLALFAYAYAAVLLLRRQASVVPIIREPVVLFAIGTVIAAAFAASYSLTPMVARARVIQIASMVLFMAIMPVVTRPSRVMLFVLPSLFLFLATTLYDLATYEVGFNFGVDYLLGWVKRKTALGVDPNDWCLRVYAMAPLWATSISMLKRPALRTGLFGVLALVMLATPALTASRLGFFLMIIVSAIIFRLLPEHSKLLKRITLAAVVVGPMVIPLKGLWARLELLMDPAKEAGAGSSSLSHRGYALQLAVKHFEENPLSGIGLESFPITTGEFTAGGVKLAAHNAYATIAAEQGLIGLLVWGAFGVALATLYWRGRKLPVGGSYRLFVDAIGAGLLVVALGLFTLNLLYQIQLWFLFGMLLGLVLYGRRVILLRGAAPLHGPASVATPSAEAAGPELAAREA